MQEVLDLRQALGCHRCDSTGTGTGAAVLGGTEGRTRDHATHSPWPTSSTRSARPACSAVTEPPVVDLDTRWNTPLIGNRVSQISIICQRRKVMGTLPQSIRYAFAQNGRPSRPGIAGRQMTTTARDGGGAEGPSGTLGGGVPATDAGDGPGGRPGARRPQRAAACRGTRTRPGHELVNPGIPVTVANRAMPGHLGRCSHHLPHQEARNGHLPPTWGASGEWTLFRRGRPTRSKPSGPGLRARHRMRSRYAR